MSFFSPDIGHHPSALANLAADDACALQVASHGGVLDLVSLAKSGSPGTQEQAARALANLAAHVDSAALCEALRAVPELVPVLVGLTRAPSHGSKQVRWRVCFCVCVLCVCVVCGGRTSHGHFPRRPISARAHSSRIAVPLPPG